LPLFAEYAKLLDCLHKPHLYVKFAGAGYSFALMVFFTVRAICMIRRHKRNLESDFSYTEECTLQWMWWAIGIAFLQWSNIKGKG